MKKCNYVSNMYSEMHDMIGKIIPEYPILEQKFGRGRQICGLQNLQNFCIIQASDESFISDSVESGFLKTKALNSPIYSYMSTHEHGGSIVCPFTCISEQTCIMRCHRDRCLSAQVPIQRNEHCPRVRKMTGVDELPSLGSSCISLLRPLSQINVF